MLCIQLRWYRGFLPRPFWTGEFLFLKIGGGNMLGMQDIWVSAAWVLSIGSAVGCVVYGAIHWNYEDEEE